MKAVFHIILSIAIVTATTCESQLAGFTTDFSTKLEQWEAESAERTRDANIMAALGVASAGASYGASSMAASRASGTTATTDETALAVGGLVIGTIPGVTAAMHANLQDDWPKLGASVLKLAKTTAQCFTEMAQSIQAVATVLVSNDITEQFVYGFTHFQNIIEQYEYVTCFDIQQNEATYSCNNDLDCMTNTIWDDSYSGDACRARTWQNRITRFEYILKYITDIYAAMNFQWNAYRDGAITFDGSSGGGLMMKPDSVDQVTWTSLIQASYSHLLTMHFEGTRIALDVYSILKDFKPGAEELRSLENSAAGLLVKSGGDCTHAMGELVGAEVLDCVSTQKEKMVGWFEDSTKEAIRARIDRYTGWWGRYPSLSCTDPERYTWACSMNDQHVCEPPRDRHTGLLTGRRDWACPTPRLPSTAAMQTYETTRDVAITNAEGASFSSVGPAHYLPNLKAQANNGKSVTFTFRGTDATYTERSCWASGWSSSYCSFSHTISPSTMSTSTMESESIAAIHLQYKYSFDTAYAHTCDKFDCNAYGTPGTYETRPGASEVFCTGLHNDGRQEIGCAGEADLEACCRLVPPPPPPGSCFDAATQFETRNGTKRADELRVGDEVRTAAYNGSMIWDRIAMSTSDNEGSLHQYLKISTGGHSLTLTPNHLLHVIQPGKAAVCCTEATLLPAADVSSGDLVWGLDSSTGEFTPLRVTSIDVEEHPGAYNFILLQDGATSGFHSLVAGGIVASSFTTDWRLMASHGALTVDKLGEPVRDLYRAGLHLEGDDVGSAGANSGMNLAKAVGQLQDIIADCVEASMHNCTEEAVHSRVATVVLETKATLPSSVLEQIFSTILDLKELHAANESGALGGSRRLAARGLRALTKVVSVDTIAHVMGPIVIEEIERVVVVQAASICAMEAACAADMAHHPPKAWTPPMIALVALAAACTLLLLSVLAVLLFLFHRKKTRANTNATSRSSAPTAPAAATSPMELDLSKV